MTVPYLTKDDVIAILKDDNILDVQPQINGGQKAVVQIITKDNKYLAKFIELPKSAFCTIGDDSENIEDVSLGRLKREIEILYRSNCENVVKVFSNKLNYVEYNGHNLYYYTEEFVNGTDINKLLQDKYLFSIEEIFNFAYCINNAISCLWANKVIHRDIKPQNVIYDKINGRFVLIDPGIAFDLDDISYTQTGQFIGTPLYMSPEQLHSKKRDLDFRSDHFLLGICLYSMATGVHPFFIKAKSVPEVQYNIINVRHRPILDYNPDFPQGLSRIIDRLLSKEPFKRYRTPNLLIEDLKKAQGEYYDSIHTT